jgi:AcrR family transcriptional regulator
VTRPETISSDEIMAAAAVVIGRVGPGFTLADIAAEAGTSTGTLVHRFGSKHGLLVAMMSAAVASATKPKGSECALDPVVSVRDALVARYAAVDDPATAPHHLAQLAAELGDKRLRAWLADLHLAVAAGLHPLLAEAQRAGALAGAPPLPVAARILAAAADGTAIHWSARPEGSLRARLTADLDAILAGWARSTPEADMAWAGI